MDFALPLQPPDRRAGGITAAAMRLRWVLPVLLLAGTALAAWSAFRLVPFWTWSAARLAASARVAFDLPLYPSPGDGTITGWVYGPVSAMAYLPAIAAGEPLAALQVAAWLNAGYFLLPALGLGALTWGGQGRSHDALLVAGFGVAAWLLPYATWYGAAALSADTVALCLGTTSCLALGRRRLWPVAAALGVLAAWTKQPDVLLVAAQAGYLAGTAGVRGAARYFGWWALWAGVFTVVFGLWFGWAGLWEGMVLVPGRHPIETARLPGLVWSWLLSTWWVWPLALVVRRPVARTPAAAGAELRSAGDLLVLASLVLLPGGLLGAAKAGGDQNSLHAIAYATLGGTAWLGTRLVEAGPAAIRYVRPGLLAGWAIMLGLCGQRIIAHDHLAIAEPGSQHRAAFAFTRARPGQVCFPCNPLITLLAEGRDTPFDYGLYDWRLAGLAPPPPAIRAQVPATVQWMIYHEKDPSRELVRVLPEFRPVGRSGPWDLYHRNGVGPAEGARSSP